MLYTPVQLCLSLKGFMGKWITPKIIMIRRRWPRVLFHQPDHKRRRSSPARRREIISEDSMGPTYSLLGFPEGADSVQGLQAESGEPSLERSWGGWVFLAIFGHLWDKERYWFIIIMKKHILKTCLNYNTAPWERAIWPKPIALEQTSDGHSHNHRGDGHVYPANKGKAPKSPLMVNRACIWFQSIELE